MRRRRQLTPLWGSRQRGSLLLGIAAITLILGTLGAILLSRAVDIYRGSAIFEQRLQLRAAAEGAVVVLAANPARVVEPIIEGRCRVEVGAPAAEAGRLRVPLSVRLLGNGGAVVLEQPYTAEFLRPSGAEPWKFACLEKELLP